MRQEILTITKTKIDEVVRGIEGGNGGTTMRKALANAQEFGNVHLIDERLAGIKDYPQEKRVVKALARLTYAARKIHEALYTKEIPEGQIDKVLLENADSQDAIRTAVFLLKDDVFNDGINRVTLTKLFDQQFTTSIFTQLFDAIPTIGGLDEQSTVALRTILTTVTSKPEFTAQLFNELRYDEKQRILQAILDHPVELGNLGVQLALSGVTRDQRKLTSTSRQAKDQREGVVESANVGETIVAVRNPTGWHVGFIKPGYAINRSKPPDTVVTYIGIGLSGSVEGVNQSTTHEFPLNDPGPLEVI